MLIKRVQSNTYDVFLGEGFTHWSRVRRGHWGVSVVAGIRLPKNVLKDVQQLIK